MSNLSDDFDKKPTTVIACSTALNLELPPANKQIDRTALECALHPAFYVIGDSNHHHMIMTSVDRILLHSVSRFIHQGCLRTSIFGGDLMIFFFSFTGIQVQSFSIG